MPDQSPRAIGLRLRRIRKDAKMTQAAFAVALGGCSQGLISAIEVGSSAPSALFLSALEHLNYSASWLMTGAGQMLRPTDTPDSSNPSDPLLVRDAPSSLPPSSILIPLPPSVQAGDVLVVRVDRRDHPLALIGKILYTLPRK